MANFILKLTFPIIFNVIALTVYLTSEKDTSLLPILFINLAYFALIIVPSKIAGPRKEKVLSWTIYLVSWGYFLTEFLVGIILLVVNTKNTFLSFSIQLILLGIYVVVVSASHITLISKLTGFIFTFQYLNGIIFHLLMN